MAVLICGQELQIHRIERDETMIAQLMALEAQFWERVQSGQAPDADASESTAVALRSLYPQDSGDTVDLTEDESACSAFTKLLHVRKLLQAWEAQECVLCSVDGARLQGRCAEIVTIAPKHLQHAT